MPTPKPRFRPAKFRALVQYVIQQCAADPTFCIEKLHALLYIIEMRCYLELGHTISNPTFIKRPWGIECKELQDTLNQLLQNGSITLAPTRDYFSMV